MASGATPIYLLPYPFSTDPVDVHGDIQELSDRLEIVLGVKVDKNVANTLTKTNTYTLTGADNGIIINQAGSGVPLRITNTGTGNSFLVEDSSSTDSTPFVIDASGNVGILKAVPTVALDVAGAGAFTGALTASTFNALSLTSNATGYTISGGTTAVGVTFAGGSAYTISGTNGTTITLPSSTGTLPLNNQAFFIGTTSTTINRASAAQTIAGLTLTTPIIDTINISALGVSGELWNTTITTGSISTGGSLTTGGINIATGSAFNGTVAIATGAGTVNKTINIGTASTSGTTAITIGSSSGATSTVTLNGTVSTSSNLTVGGNLTVNGTTTTINSTTVNVDDILIELGAVASPTDVTAEGGGVSLLGATNKTITWSATGNNWTSSENWNIANTKTFKINNTSVLSSTVVLGLTPTINAIGFRLSGGTTAKYVQINNDIILAGTDGSTLNIGAGGTLGSAAFTASTAYISSTLMTTLGDTIYGGASGASTRLAGNTTTTKQFLGQTGNGTISAAPSWSALANADIPSALTGKSYNGLTLTSTTGTFTLAAGKTFTVNNTLTLSGTDSSTLNIGTGGTLGTAAFTASTAYEPAITTLAISKGGTGTGTAPTQYGVIYASSSTTYASTSVGTAGQVLTVNGTANGYIWSSPLTNPMTTAGDIIYGGASGASIRLAGSATNGYILTYNTTTNAPYWAVAPAGYSAPTLGSTSIASGATVSNINALTINSTTIPTSATLLTSGGALGTPSGGTLTNVTGLPIAGLVASTTTALGVGSIELGHATDTTISRVSAGVIAIEGVTIDTISGANTLTNKTLTSPTITTPQLQLETTSRTTEGSVSWDSTNDYLRIGSGTVAKSFFPFDVNTTAKTAAYPLVLADANTLIQMNGAFAFTVPLNSTVAYPTGTSIHLIALTTGVSVTFTSGITFYATPGRNLRAAGSMATLIKLGTDTWVLTGDLTA